MEHLRGFGHVSLCIGCLDRTFPNLPKLRDPKSLNAGSVAYTSTGMAMGHVDLLVERHL